MFKVKSFEEVANSEHIRADLRSHSVRAAGFTGLSGIGEFIIRLGSTAILARLILPEHFGLVMMVMAVTAVADQLRELGLSTATVQRKDITHEEVSNLFWINALFGGLIALVVCLLAPVVASYYRDPRLFGITCVLATNFLFGGLLVQHQALLTRQLKLGHTSALRLGTSLVSTLVAIWLAWLGWGYWALVWREVVRSVLLTTGMFLCCPWVPGLPSRKTDIRSYMRFGMHLSAANILGSIAGGADRLLIGRFWGAAPVAMYRQAYQLLVMPVEQLLNPIYQVTQPGLSMLQHDPPRFRRFYQKVLASTCAVTMPLSVIVAMYSNEITVIVLGARWADAAPLLFILSLGVFIRQPIGSSAFILIAQGRSRIFLNLTILQIAGGVLAILAGLPWGTIGVATADVAVTYLLMYPRLHYTLKDSPVSVGSYFATLVRPLTAAAIMLGILVGVREFTHDGPALLSLVVGGAVGSVAFVAAWILLPGGRTEIRDMAGSLRTAYQRKVVRSPGLAEPNALTS